MAFIPYAPEEQAASADRIPDQDSILQIHGVHSRVMRLHYELYVELMRRPGPVVRRQRELIATVVSATNGCHY